jgi:predicted acetyltransferase
MVDLVEKKFDNERKVYSYDIETNGQIVGRAQLRLQGSKSETMPAGFESHVFYSVDEEERGKGYATQALAQIIKEANKHQMDRLVLTVNSANQASVKVITKNGGQLVDEGKTQSGDKVLKYEILTQA